MKYFNYCSYKDYIKGTSIDNQQHLKYLQSRKLELINVRNYEYIETKSYENGFTIQADKIINIYRTNTFEYDGKSLYELLNNGHPFRHRSLHEFFEKTNATSITASKEWLRSRDCAFSDYSSTRTSTGELPSAYYFEGIDKYLITTGQNRAFAGLLIGAKEYKVESISYYRPKEKVITEDGLFLENKLDNNRQGILHKFKKWIIGK
ncbi:hypothetical protein [Neobacillus sp.]|uniref:hypothetical protein n=1 Tax=Neobacillus sp. TaxID=2675273 RepID=UPI0035B55AE8